MTAWIRKEVIGDCTLYLGDALEVLPTRFFDAVVTDPPYMMGSASTRAGKGFRSRLGEWTNSSLWYSEWMRPAWQRLPATGSMWVCGNWRSMPVLTIAADSFGASTSSVIVWDKEWIGVGSNKGLRQRYELIFQFGRESFGIPNRSEPDIWPVAWASSRPSGHESEKPVALMERAIGHCVGEVIIDPFMGSGTTGVACAKMGRKFTGIEIEPTYYETALRRIEEAYRQPDIFGEREKPAVQQPLFGDAA